MGKHWNEHSIRTRRGSTEFLKYSMNSPLGRFSRWNISRASKWKIYNKKMVNILKSWKMRSAGESCSWLLQSCLKWESCRATPILPILPTIRKRINLICLTLVPLTSIGRSFWGSTIASLRGRLSKIGNKFGMLPSRLGSSQERKTKLWKAVIFSPFWSLAILFATKADTISGNRKSPREYTRPSPRC